jgi:hypothetical protein
MKKNLILAFVFAVAFLTGCGRLTENTEIQADEGIDPQMVAMADGTMMDVSCVRQNAKAIMEQGRGAADSCVVGNAKNKTTADGRGFGSSYPNWWSYYYIYPPTYYNGGWGYGSGSSSGGSNLCAYLGFYGNGYSSTNGYGYGYGYGTSYNCYNSFLGYDPYYTGSYNTNCDYCLNKLNPQRCYNKCLYKDGWYW